MQQQFERVGVRVRGGRRVPERSGFKNEESFRVAANFASTLPTAGRKFAKNGGPRRRRLGALVKRRKGRRLRSLPGGRGSSGLERLRRRRGFGGLRRLLGRRSYGGLQRLLERRVLAV